MSYKIGILVILSLFFYSGDSYSQQVVPENIYRALGAGNSKELIKYFNANIELDILNKAGVYSKTQSEVILKTFFHKNIPNNCLKLHEGKVKTFKYSICRLFTSKGTYRIVFMMSRTKSKLRIQQFSIEDDSYY